MKVWAVELIRMDTSNICSRWVGDSQIRMHRLLANFQSPKYFHERGNFLSVAVSLKRNDSRAMKTTMATSARIYSRVIWHKRLVAIIDIAKGREEFPHSESRWDGKFFISHFFCAERATLFIELRALSSRHDSDCQTFIHQPPAFESLATRILNY